MSDLAEDLRAAGHSVSVITTRPHGIVDEVARCAQPLRRRWGGLYWTSKYHGIPVIHTWMPRQGKARGKRIWGWASFHFLGLLAGLFAVEAPDVIIVPSPLLTAGVVAWIMCVLRGGRFIYNVQELYPDLAVRMGMLRNPILIGALRRLERFVYAKASAVTVIGKSMHAEVSRQVSPTKVRLIPNFVDLKAIPPVEKPNDFARAHGLADKFVVSYAGNMGRAQGLDRLLDAAALLRDEPEILFVLVGEGVMRSSLVQRAEQLRLTNTVFIGQQPFATVPSIYGASDVCVVPMLAEIAAEAVPSKVYRIMAAERPVLALTPPDGDLGTLVRDSQAGIVLDPVTPEGISEAIRRLHRDSSSRIEMGTLGRRYVATHFARELVTRQYDDLVVAAPASP